MGYFSFTKADRATKAANIQHDKPFKLLIPQCFGGGYIKDSYQGFGKISDGTNTYDMCELIAFWNAEMPYKGKTVRDYLAGQFSRMKTIDADTDANRDIGIDIMSDMYKGMKLKYPPKLVSPSCTATYESILSYSFGDPNQGCGVLRWDEYDEYLLRQLSRSKGYTEKDISFEDLIVAIETNSDGSRDAHLYGYGYCTHDASQPDCRFVHYTFFIVPLHEALMKGIFTVELEQSEFIKQYINDVTEEEMHKMYREYAAGKCPIPIIEEQLHANLPDGTYVVRYPEAKRA